MNQFVPFLGLLLVVSSCGPTETYEAAVATYDSAIREYDQTIHLLNQLDSLTRFQKKDSADTVLITDRNRFESLETELMSWLHEVKVVPGSQQGIVENQHEKPVENDESRILQRQQNQLRDIRRVKKKLSQFRTELDVRIKASASTGNP